MKPNVFRLAVCVCMAVFALAFLSGCVPISRSELSTSDDEISINPDKYCVSVSVLTQTSDPTKKPTIDTSRSFAVSPSGKRFNLEVEKNEYAFEDSKTNKTPWTLETVSLIDPSQKPGKDNFARWKNGNWKLDLFFTGPTSRPPIHSEFRIYTFWYCPLFMRPF